RPRPQQERLLHLDGRRRHQGRDDVRGDRRTRPGGRRGPGERARLARDHFAPARAAPRSTLPRTERPQGETDRRGGGAGGEGDSRMKKRGTMTEAEWFACTDTLALLRRAQFRSMSRRKSRLFAVACCRCIWDLLVDERSRQAVDVAQRHADGLATDDELRVA